MTEEQLPPAREPAPVVPPAPPPPPPPAPPQTAGRLYGRNTLIAIGAVTALYAGITAWQLATPKPAPATQEPAAPPAAAPADAPTAGSGEGVETSTAPAASGN